MTGIPTGDHIRAYVHGAGQNGRGGFAVLLEEHRDGSVVKRKEKTRNASGSHHEMTLRAVVLAMRSAKSRGIPLLIVTSNEYVSDSGHMHMAKWKANGWRKKDGKPIAHCGLWKEIDRLTDKHETIFAHIRKDDPDDQFERVCELARQAAGTA